MMNGKCICNDFKDFKIQICFRQKGNTRYINNLKFLSTSVSPWAKQIQKL